MYLFKNLYDIFNNHIIPLDEVNHPLFTRYIVCFRNPVHTEICFTFVAQILLKGLFQIYEYRNIFDVFSFIAMMMIDILPTVNLFVFQLFVASSVVKLSRELNFIILYKLILFILLVFGSYFFLF